MNRRRRWRVERRFSAAFAADKSTAWAAAVMTAAAQALIVQGDLERQPEGWLYLFYGQFSNAANVLRIAVRKFRPVAPSAWRYCAARSSAWHSPLTASPGEAVPAPWPQPDRVRHVPSCLPAGQIR